MWTSFVLNTGTKGRFSPLVSDGQNDQTKAIFLSMSETTVQNRNICLAENMKSHSVNCFQAAKYSELQPQFQLCQK